MPQPTPIFPQKTKVITYAKQPDPTIGKIMARCRTQYWKPVIQNLAPWEMLKMTDLLEFVCELLKCS